MAYIYAMSDMHGEIAVFKEALNVIDLHNKKNKLILLGDYIDENTALSEILDFLYLIKELSEKYLNQVIVLKGNHEELFIGSSIFGHSLSKSPDGIFMKNRELLDWLKRLPYYYETDTQIFVHAGVDEEAEELWKHASENYFFCSKFPQTTGKFYKDIIAGHIYTATIANVKNYCRVFWDKESHFFIDGHTTVSKVIPVLKYDVSTKKYYGIEKIKLCGDDFEWREYAVTYSHHLTPEGI